MPSGVADPHGWNSWDGYLGAHNGKLGTYRDYFLIDDRLETLITRDVVSWTGELICTGGYEIHIRRLQVADHRNGVLWVKTSKYSYHALRRTGDTTRQLFRYDNIHAHAHHADEHHRHRFDTNGREILPAVHIGAVQWPTLGQVLDELYVYWQDKL